MIVQNCGREITIEERPERVLTIGAEAPTLVAAAGAADRLVARSGEYGSPLGRYESALEGVPELTTGHDDPATEAIIGQDPDLVITRGSESAEALEAAGVDRIVIGGRCRGPDDEVTAEGTFDEVYSDIELYGRLLGTGDAATTAVADLRERVTAVEQRFGEAPQRRAAAVIYAEGGIGSYGRLSIAHQQMQALGLSKVFAGSPERFFEPSIEEIIERDPQALIVLYDEKGETAEGNRARLLAQPELAEVSAIRDGDILVLPFALSASSPLAVQGLETLADQLDELG